MDDVNIGVKCVALINSGCIAKSNHFWFEKKKFKTNSSNWKLSFVADFCFLNSSVF